MPPFSAVAFRARQDVGSWGVPRVSRSRRSLIRAGRNGDLGDGRWRLSRARSIGGCSRYHRDHPSPRRPCGGSRCHPGEIPRDPGRRGGRGRRVSLPSADRGGDRGRGPAHVVMPGGCGDIPAGRPMDKAPSLDGAMICSDGEEIDLGGVTLRFRCGRGPCPGKSGGLRPRGEGSPGVRQPGVPLPGRGVLPGLFHRLRRVYGHRWTVLNRSIRSASASGTTGGWRERRWARPLPWRGGARPSSGSG